MLAKLFISLVPLLVIAIAAIGTYLTYADRNHPGAEPKEDMFCYIAAAFLVAFMLWMLYILWTL